MQDPNEVSGTCADCGDTFSDPWLLGGELCSKCTAKAKQIEADSVYGKTKKRPKRKRTGTRAKRKAARRSRRKNRAA